MGENHFDVIAAGHLCLDMTPRFNTDRDTSNISDILQPGTLVQMGEMTFSTGGSVSNVGIAMKIFGCSVGFVAKVGADAIGRIIIEMLEKNGSAEGISVAENEASSYSVVISAPGIDRIFMHCSGTNDTFGSADLNLAAVEKSRLFHLGYPWLRESLNLAKEFSNVYLNFCWLHVISRTAARRVMEEAIETIPVNKITGFGGDYHCPALEKVFGHLRMAKENIADAFARKVEDGWMGADEAIDVINKYLYDNPKQLYGI